MIRRMNVGHSNTHGSNNSTGNGNAESDRNGNSNGAPAGEGRHGGDGDVGDRSFPEGVFADSDGMPTGFDATDLQGERAPRSAEAISLRGARVQLEIPDDRHLMRLWELVADPATSFRWKYHGRVPSPQELADSLWDGVATQFVAVDRTSGRPVAWVIAYNLNARDQHAFLAVHGWPEHLASVTLLDAVFVFLRYLFANFSLRKIYAEVREFNVTQFASGAGRFFEIEGRLQSHSFYDGIWWDQLILSLTAERFAEVEARYGRRWFGGADDAPDDAPAAASDLFATR
jgi:RimJ/RimL family protein N-acetyltransferase